MAFSILSLPDCTGRWMWGAHFSHSAMAVKSFSVASLGWLVMNRMRKSPSMALIFRSRSAKSVSSSSPRP